MTITCIKTITFLLMYNIQLIGQIQITLNLEVKKGVISCSKNLKKTLPDYFSCRQSVLTVFFASSQYNLQFSFPPWINLLPLYYRTSLVLLYDRTDKDLCPVFSVTNCPSASASHSRLVVMARRVICTMSQKSRSLQSFPTFCWRVKGNSFLIFMQRNFLRLLEKRCLYYFFFNFLNFKSN